MIVDEAYDKAIEVIIKSCRKNGLYASVNGYDSVWARDSIISFLGASLIDNKFKKAFEKTLVTLSRYQSKLGQIPNNVDIFSDSKTKNGISYATIDSSLWYIIGHYLYASRYKDNRLLRRYRDNIDRALLWVKYQDAGEDLMPEQQPTSDWQDAFPHKYGHTINTQALYYKSLNLVGEKNLAGKLKSLVNGRSDKALFDRNRGFYLPFAWKNHDGIKEEGDWFDSLGNLLAVNFDLASRNESISILKYIKSKKIDKPYPVKAIYPPITKKSKHWQDYYVKSGSLPNKYLNGGIWTYIGGFYVVGLVKMGKINEARKVLKKLAEANIRGNFAEWMDGKTGKPGGGKSEQTWNAGLYILAYESVEKNKNLINI
ncbi:MAG: glycoside hydrolase 100 family protein [Nanoarchaeota archaeon]